MDLNKLMEMMKTAGLFMKHGLSLEENVFTPQVLRPTTRDGNQIEGKGKKEETEPRNSWPLARITEPKVSTDGLVQSALVNCQGKVFNRAVTDMVYIMST